MKNTAIVVLVLIILAGIGAYFFYLKPPAAAPGAEQPATSTEQAATTTENAPTEVIGKSAGGRDITAYHYGTGSKELLFIADLHGGYEWNTALLAYNLMDYLAQNPNAIPANEKVTVIPTLNPDGLAKVTGKDGRFTADDIPASQAATVPGRFNANNVDLNRNFDCDWQAKGVWQSTPVSGGTAAFSEPETQAIRDYVAAHTPTAVVAYYSAAGGVYSSNCHGGVSPETTTITKAYADASGYAAHEDFNFYDITGDMVNWLAKQQIPAISIVLTNHTSTEWDKNEAGIKALLAHYAE